MVQMQKINLNCGKRKIYKLLPRGIRQKLIRFFLPELKPHIDNVTFKAAVSPQEYLAAFNLVYKVFVESGFTSPSPTPFRLAPQHCNDQSRVFIGINSENGEEKLIYSVSAFPDSDLGLPMDEVFKDELNLLRNKDRNLVEVGHLAIAPDYRFKTMQIPMLGNKTVIQYAIEFLKADDIVITIHPKYQWFYEEMMLFEKIGEIREYAYANNNPAIAMRLDLNTMRARYKEYYKGAKKQYNFYEFFFKTDSRSIELPGLSYVDGQLLEKIKKFYGL